MVQPLERVTVALSKAPAYLVRTVTGIVAVAVLFAASVAVGWHTASAQVVGGDDWDPSDGFLMATLEFECTHDVVITPDMSVPIQELTCDPPIVQEVFVKYCDTPPQGFQVMISGTTIGGTPETHELLPTLAPDVYYFRSYENTVNDVVPTWTIASSGLAGGGIETVTVFYYCDVPTNQDQCEWHQRFTALPGCVSRTKKILIDESQIDLTCLEDHGIKLKVEVDKCLDTPATSGVVYLVANGRIVDSALISNGEAVFGCDDPVTPDELPGGPNSYLQVILPAGDLIESIAVSAACCDCDLP